MARMRWQQQAGARWCARCTPQPGGCIVVLASRSNALLFPGPADRAGEQVNAALGAGVLGFLHAGVVESVPMQVGVRGLACCFWPRRARVQRGTDGSPPWDC